MLTRPRNTQMLWNWYTIDTCFIASSWHVRSAGAFAVSCIGVVLLVVLLEFLRRSTKEFDRFLIARSLARRDLASSSASTTAPVHRASSSSAGAAADDDSKAPKVIAVSNGGAAAHASPRVAKRSLWDVMFLRRAAVVVDGADEPYLPTMPEQAARALLHMFQFAVAYFVML